jgi:hypothetical protein
MDFYRKPVLPAFALCHPVAGAGKEIYEHHLLH